VIHPDLHQWKIAKKAALAIAAHMGAEILQSPDGHRKRVIIGKRMIDHSTWYACYCTLWRIRLDQITKGGTVQQAKGPDPPPRF
jgi:hypothetical protein